jgi:predicted transcriptional regulator YheO
LQRKAEILNSSFAENLKENEVNSIVNSIDTFIKNKFKKGFYMALSVEDRKKVASANGKKSGEARSKVAETKILTALNMMESFEMKITIRELAKRSGTSVNTVRKYLEKIDYKSKK